MEQKRRKNYRPKQKKEIRIKKDEKDATYSRMISDITEKAIIQSETSNSFLIE